MTPDENQKQKELLDNCPKDTNSWEIKTLSNLKIRFKKSSGLEVNSQDEEESSEVHAGDGISEEETEDASEAEMGEGSEEEKWEGSEAEMEEGSDEEMGDFSEAEMEEGSEEEMAEGSEEESYEVESSEEESFDDDTELIPTKGPFECTICNIKTHDRIYIIEHILEFHCDELTSSSEACLRLRVKKHYEEMRMNGIKQDGSSQSICDEVPRLTLGGSTEECNICHRRIYKSCMVTHTINCIERNSKITTEPGLIENFEKGEFSGNSRNRSKESSSEVHFENDDCEDINNDINKNNFGPDLPNKEFNQTDDISDDEATNECETNLLNEKGIGKKRPTHYMTKSKIMEKKKEDKEATKLKYKEAVEAWSKGEYSSVLKCAKSRKVPYTTLYRLIVTGDEYTGSGRYSKCLTQEEEEKIVHHVIWRASIGCGVTWSQLRELINEVLLKIKEESPERMTGLENTNQWPNQSYVRRFAERHNLTLRKTNEISKGRQILTVEDLQMWQEETRNFMFKDEKLAEAMKNPRRVFNQDESAIEMGSASQRVLNKKGAKVIFNVSSGSREHITASYTVNAQGEMVPPRIVYKGKRNVAKSKLSNLSQTGKSGKWQFSVAPRGYMTRELYCESLRDLDEFITINKIERPVVLHLDGATSHISLEAARLCKEFKIQPWLFKPNMTHILQPLDLTFFSSLKSNLKQLAYNWQCKPENAGEYLNRYSVVHLLRQATEVSLSNPETVPNGFKRGGLVPWDESMPDKNKLLPGSIFEKSTNTTENSDQDVGNKDTQEPDENENKISEELDDKTDNLHDQNDDLDKTDNLDNETDLNDKSDCEDELNIGGAGEPIDNSKPTNSNLKTIPQYSLEDRCSELNKFEVVFLSPDQIREFEMLLVKKKTSNEPLFEAWMKLKVATIQPKSTAVEKVLAEKKINVPLRKRKRNVKQPTGAARYDPSSVEWVEILQEQEEKKREKENKNPEKKKKTK